MSQKLGQKSQGGGGLLGQKSIHAGATIGVKTLQVAKAFSPLVSLVAPEVGVPLGIGASVGLTAAKGLEKATRKA